VRWEGKGSWQNASIFRDAGMRFETHVFRYTLGEDGSVSGGTECDNHFEGQGWERKVSEAWILTELSEGMSPCTHCGTFSV